MTLASTITSRIRNTAVYVTSTHSNPGMCQVFRAADNVPVATVVELEGHYEYFAPSGTQYAFTTIAAVVSHIKLLNDRFPKNVRQDRCWSKIQHIEETF